MSKDEAIAAMQAGDKVTHNLFLSEAFVYYDIEGVLTDNNGYVVIKTFWESKWSDGWSIYKPK